MKNPDNKVHCVAVHLLCSTDPARVETFKLAYYWDWWDGWHGYQPATSTMSTVQGNNRAYCCAGLAISSLVMAETIASIHCT